MFGFIKKLFGGLLGFLGGLLGFLGGLFGGKKSGKKSKDSGYFLEFEDAQGIGNAPAKPEAATPNVAQTSTPEAPAPVVAVAAGQPEIPATAPAPAVKPVAVAPKPAPVAATKPAVPAGPATFAPQYLAPKPTNSRRRPGPSLSPYLTMAKQMR